MIDSTSSSSDSDGGYANIASLMNHKKDFISMMFRDKVDNSVDHYKGKKFSEIDKRIMKGLVK